MLSRIIDWSARHALLVLALTLAVVGGGVYALLHTPLDAQPDLSDVQVIVYTEAPGQAPRMVAAGIFVTPNLGDSLLADPDLTSLARQKDGVRTEPSPATVSTVILSVKPATSFSSATISFDFGERSV